MLLSQMRMRQLIIIKMKNGVNALLTKTFLPHYGPLQLAEPSRSPELFSDSAYMSHLLLLGKSKYTGGPIFKVVLEC